MFPLSRKGTFYGGIFLPTAKASTQNKPIRTLPLPEKLFVPLEQDAECVVQAGQMVQAEQALARGASSRHQIFSPVNGKVLGKTVVSTARHREVPAVELSVMDTDFKAPQATTDTLADWKNISDEDVSLALRRCGVVGRYQSESCPVELIQQAHKRGVRYFIVSAMESEPCLTADHRVLCEHRRLMVRTIACLHKFLKVRRSYLAIDQDKPDLIKKCHEAARRSPVRVLGLPNRYPIGTPPLLMQSILGREIPRGSSALDVGVIVLDVGSVFHLARAIAQRTPQTASVITVSGGAVDRPGNYWIPNGTMVSHVLESVGLQHPAKCLTVGGPMTGIALPHADIVLTSRCSALLAYSPRDADFKAPSPCVRCGWCVEVCPMRLEPALLLRAIDAQRHDAVRRLHADVCIECGLCSYVCPSSLPLAGSIGQAKRELMQEKITGE